MPNPEIRSLLAKSSRNTLDIDIAVDSFDRCGKIDLHSKEFKPNVGGIDSDDCDYLRGIIGIDTFFPIGAWYGSAMLGVFGAYLHPPTRTLAFAMFPAHDDGGSLLGTSFVHAVFAFIQSCEQGTGYDDDSDKNASTKLRKHFFRNNRSIADELSLSVDPLDEQHCYGCSGFWGPAAKYYNTVQAIAISRLYDVAQGERAVDRPTSGEKIFGSYPIHQPHSIYWDDFVQQVDPPQVGGVSVDPLEMLCDWHFQGVSWSMIDPARRLSFRSMNDDLPRSPRNIYLTCMNTNIKNIEKIVHEGLGNVDVPLMWSMATYLHAATNSGAELYDLHATLRCLEVLKKRLLDILELNHLFIEVG